MYGCVWAYWGVVTQRDHFHAGSTALYWSTSVPARLAMRAAHAYRSNVAEASEGWGAVDETEGC